MIIIITCALRKLQDSVCPFGCKSVALAIQLTYDIDCTYTWSYALKFLTVKHRSGVYLYLAPFWGQFFTKVSFFSVCNSAINIC
jgi:hypothetical protein